MNRREEEEGLFHFVYNAFLVVVTNHKKSIFSKENFLLHKGNWPVIGYYFSLS